MQANAVAKTMSGRFQKKKCRRWCVGQRVESLFWQASFKLWDAAAATASALRSLRSWACAPALRGRLNSWFLLRCSYNIDACTPQNLFPSAVPLPEPQHDGRGCVLESLYLSSSFQYFFKNKLNKDWHLPWKRRMWKTQVALGSSHASKTRNKWMQLYLFIDRHSPTFFLAHAL